MAETKIEWADFTFNPWMGCTKVSPACANCYAAVETPVRVLRGQGVELWGEQGERRRTSEANWRSLLKWNRKAICLHCGFAEWDGSDDCRKCGNEFNKRRRPRVFCASLADVFEDREELAPWREDLFELIAETTNLDWLLLTKRPENLNSMLPWTADHLGEYRERFWPNVWIGTTVENQEYADKRIPELLKIPARVRFLSCEPLLGPINLRDSEFGIFDLDWLQKIGWIIVGGESGPNARPMDLTWARSIHDQCKTAGVAFFGKQWDKKKPLPDDLMVRQFPEAA